MPGHLQTLRLKGSRGGLTGSASYLVTDPDVADNGIGGVLLDWQGGTGTLAPVSGAVASNTVLTQNQLPLRGVIKICLLDPGCGALLELERTVPTTTPSSNVGSAIVGVGVGGTVTGTAASFTGTTPPIQYTLEGAPWTPKTASVVDQVETTGGNSVFTTATLQGWAHGPASATTSTAAVNYHFSTGGGAEVFFDLLARELAALLGPNYTDEEIRREVRHFGVATAADGSQRLEEKGSVYNEMTSSTANLWRVLGRASGHLVYGARHPLAYNSGGEPSGIRTMKHEDIRRFHASSYHLANMGTIAAFPRRLAVGEALSRVDAILAGLAGGRASAPASRVEDLPPAAGAPAGTEQVVEFPHRDDAQPGPKKNQLV